MLPPEIRARLDVRIVGSSFEHDLALERKLERLVLRWCCSECISFEPFSDKPENWYEWCDLVVVPSTLPEPFGRVAIEAMSFGRGSIVSGAGGLAETVVDGVTGWHVPINDPAALAATLLKVVADPPCIENFGRRSREQYEKRFRQEIIDAEFGSIVERQMQQSVCLHPGTKLNTDI
jgi:glycosyltransferase involved in cell wall biosynthesis